MVDMSIIQVFYIISCHKFNQMNCSVMPVIKLFKSIVGTLLVVEILGDTGNTVLII